MYRNRERVPLPRWNLRTADDKASKKHTSRTSLSRVPAPLRIFNLSFSFFNSFTSCEVPFQECFRSYFTSLCRLLGLYVLLFYLHIGHFVRYDFITLVFRPRERKTWKSDFIGTPKFYWTVTTRSCKAPVRLVQGTLGDILHSACASSAGIPEIARVEMAAQMASSFVSHLCGSLPRIILQESTIPPITNWHADHIPVSGRDDELLEYYRRLYVPHSDVQRTTNSTMLRY